MKLLSGSIINQELCSCPNGILGGHPNSKTTLVGGMYKNDHSLFSNTNAFRYHTGFLQTILPLHALDKNSTSPV